jgi:hypothetical protein
MATGGIAEPTVDGTRATVAVGDDTITWSYYDNSE